MSRRRARVSRFAKSVRFDYYNRGEPATAHVLDAEKQRRTSLLPFAGHGTVQPPAAPAVSALVHCRGPHRLGGVCVSALPSQPVALTANRQARPQKTTSPSRTIVSKAPPFPSEFYATCGLSRRLFGRQSLADGFDGAVQEGVHRLLELVHLGELVRRQDGTD